MFLTYGQLGSTFTTGPKLESDRNRPVRSRTQGGVGPVAGVSQSRGPDSAHLSSWGIKWGHNAGSAKGAHFDIRALIGWTLS